MSRSRFSPSSALETFIVQPGGVITFNSWSMKRAYIMRSIRVLNVVMLFGLFACDEPTAVNPVGAPSIRLGKAPSSTGPTVTSTLPSAAPRDTTLDVQILGSGFDAGSQASLQLHGVPDSRVRVTSTRYVKSTQLIANVTISADAIVDSYDAVVITAAGKKGIGTEAFAVVIRPEILAGQSAGVGGVNEAGDAAGNIGSATSCGTSPSSTIPLIWHLDSSTTLLPLGSNCSGGASGISRNGTVVGTVQNAARSSRAIWKPGPGGYTMLELGPTSEGIWPTVDGGVNDAGEVVGWGSGAIRPRLFWWSEATGWYRMQVPIGASACAVYRAINNSGSIAARCDVSGIANAYYWLDHTSAPVLLPRPAGVAGAVPHDINDAGTIVGYAVGSATKALIWTPGVSGYTASVLPDAGSGASAAAIANDGTVGGTVLKSGGSPLAATWQAGSSYKLLGTTQPNANAEVRDIAFTAGGIVATGHEGNGDIALRWRPTPLN